MAFALAALFILASLTAVGLLTLFPVEETSRELALQTVSDGNCAASSSIPEASSTPESHKSIGKYLGYVSVVLLVVITLLGSRWNRVQDLMKRVFARSSTRVLAHCVLSFLLLFLSLTHGLFHIFRKDTLFLDDFDRFLGNVATFFMFIISVNGAFQKEMIARFSFRSWWQVHAVGAGLAILATVIHVIFQVVG